MMAILLRETLQGINGDYGIYTDVLVCHYALECSPYNAWLAAPMYPYIGLSLV